MWAKKCTLAFFVALGIRTEGNAPGKLRTNSWFLFHNNAPAHRSVLWRILNKERFFFNILLIVRLLSQPVQGTATYRCDGTRGCLIQFCPPDDEHMCSKHVEAWNKLIIKFSVSTWLILINKKRTMWHHRNNPLALLTLLHLIFDLSLKWFRHWKGSLILWFYWYQ